MKSKITNFCLFLLLSLASHAQTTSLKDSLPEFSGKKLLVNDSILTFWDKTPIKIDKVSSSPIYRMTYAGGPLIIAGLLVKGSDSNFRTLRNGYAPNFKHSFDNYTQYLPAAVMLGMKIGGVQGRSSWNRMLTSDMFSIAIMASVVNVMKSTAKVTRPDGSNNRSFPSGHAATAFMTATMMHKEYGLTRSPWYSVGAYSVATATAIGRMLNNKHWFSDVMVGAGIGIISTELGYFFGDLIFKDKGITHKGYKIKPININVNPNSFGLYAGLNVMPGTYTLPDGAKLTSSVGSNVGVEGVWYPTAHWGIGGRFTIADMPVTIENEAQMSPLKLMGAYVGPYFSYPITSRWLFSTKLLAGYSYFPEAELKYTLNKKDKTYITSEPGRLSIGTGVALTYFVRQNFGMRFFADYNMLPSFISSGKKVLNSMTFGSSTCIMF